MGHLAEEESIMEIVLIGGLLLALLALVLWLAFKHGKQYAEIEKAQENEKAVRDAKKIEDDINKLSDADVSERLREWKR